MLLIDEKGERLGEVSREEAMKLAQERELDLALVAPMARPPVAKILDYGKYLYEVKRAARKAQSASKVQDTKGIRIGFRTGEHDLEVRLKQATEFINKGHKVKIMLVFKGREAQHADLGFAKIKGFAAKLEEIAKLDQMPMRQGMQIVTLLSPRK